MKDDHQSARPSFPFDHHAPEFVTQHRSIYHQMRRECPVAYAPEHGGFWVLSSYDLVADVARDDTRFSSAISLLIPPGDVDRLLPLQSDPPDLQRYRLALMPLFTPQAVERLRPALFADARDCVAGMAARGQAEVIEDLALPVPGRTTMRLLGLDPDMWDIFARPIKTVTFAHPSSAEYTKAEADIRAFGDIIAAEVDARLARPGSDGISRLIGFDHAGRRFDRCELIDLVRMLIFGGMDTVTGAVGNIVALLAQRPDLQRHMRENPAGLETAIEEFLRFEGPIQGFARRVMCPVTVAEVAIPEGDLVWLNWGAANHDPAIFADPDDIDLTRQPNKHLTFGTGGHICSGARLARAEIAAMIASLLSATRWIDLHGKGVVQPRTIGQLLGKAEVHVRLLTHEDAK